MVIGIIIFLVVKISLIFLFFKIFKLGKLFKEDDGTEEEVEARSYIPSYLNAANLNSLVVNVHEAIDKYNELVKLGENSSN